MQQEQDWQYESLEKDTRDGKLLWHYTEWPGLSGILGGGKLRASHFLYLNDEQEGLCAYDQLMQVLQDQGHGARHLIAREIEHVGFAKMADIYVACLSAHFDHLGQWRGYGASSLAFSVGFDRSALEAVAAESGFELKPCIYDPADQTALIHSIVKPLNEARERAKAIAAKHDPKTQPPHTGDLEVKSALYKFVRLTLAGGGLPSSFAQLKDLAFRDEQETRLIGARNSPAFRDAVVRLAIDFRTSGTRVIPYYDVPIRQANKAADCIRAILIGPNPRMDLVENSVNKLLEKGQAKKELGGVLVARSVVPFRSW